MSTIVGATIVIAAFAAGADAHDNFKLAYRIERVDVGKLSVGKCTEVLRQTAQEAGIALAATDTHGQVIAMTGGPPDGRGAIIADCIAAGDKTVHVVQGIGYRPGTAATPFADRARAALLEAAR